MELSCRMPLQNRSHGSNMTVVLWCKIVFVLCLYMSHRVSFETDISSILKPETTIVQCNAHAIGHCCGCVYVFPSFFLFITGSQRKDYKGNNRSCVFSMQHAMETCTCGWGVAEGYPNPTNPKVDTHFPWAILSPWGGCQLIHINVKRSILSNGQKES